jgi:hypothetical protein
MGSEPLPPNQPLKQIAFAKGTLYDFNYGQKYYLETFFIRFVSG